MTSSDIDEITYGAALELTQALSVLKGMPRFECPEALFSGAATPVFRVRHRIPDEMDVIYADQRALPFVQRFMSPGIGPDEFSDEVTDGYLAFGVEFLSDRRSVNIIQSRIGGNLLFIRLISRPWDDHSHNLEIHEYLEDLAAFLITTEDLGLSVEVVEVPGYGRYRIFDDQGRGVEKEMSLVGTIDRNKELNRLVAEIALRNAISDNKVEQFDAPDQRFQDWQFENPAGSVMVLGLTRPLIHSAGCPTMIEEQRSGFEFACAEDMRDLLVWADESYLRIPGLCSKCFTLPSKK